MHSSKYLEFKGQFRIAVPEKFTYKVYAKERWFGKKITKVFSSEFRANAVQHYDQLLKSGAVSLNGSIIYSDEVLRPNDVLEHTIHRHEPAVSIELPQVILDENGLLVVNKPPSIPVHPTGVFFANTTNELLKNYYGYTWLANINRLDRPTSGLLLLATNPTKASKLAKMMRDREIKKEYVAKVHGKFPKEISELGSLRWVNGDKNDWILCSAPLFKLECKIAISGVCAEGKQSQTLIRFTSYDPEANTSIVSCRPLTGRTHQIRVHLQYLGFPIIGDTLYSNPIWKPYLRNGSLTKQDIWDISNILQEDIKTMYEYEIVEAEFAKYFNSSSILPDWFDTNCIDCKAQWIRTFHHPYIPIFVPIGCPNSPQALCLHSYKYAGDTWSYSVPWPEWALTN